LRVAAATVLLGPFAAPVAAAVAGAAGPTTAETIAVRDELSQHRFHGAGIAARPCSPCRPRASSCWRRRGGWRRGQPAAVIGAAVIGKVRPGAARVAVVHIEKDRRLHAGALPGGALPG